MVSVNETEVSRKPASFETCLNRFLSIDIFRLDEYIGLNNKLKASNRSKDTKIQEFEDTYVFFKKHFAYLLIKPSLWYSWVFDDKVDVCVS